MMKSSSLPTSDGDESETELEQLCGSVVHIIDCLFKESSRVRNAARHSHLTEEQPIDVSAFEQHDRDHVRDKYLEADKVLVHGFGDTSPSGGTAIAIPKPPDNAIGGPPFNCPYCYRPILIKDAHAWQKHVFLDV